MAYITDHLNSWLAAIVNLTSAYTPCTGPKGLLGSTLTATGRVWGEQGERRLGFSLLPPGDAFCSSGLRPVATTILLSLCLRGVNGFCMSSLLVP